MTTEEAIRQILINIGEDPDREGLVDTPARVKKAHEEIFAGYKQDPKKILKTFTNENYDEMLTIKGIKYFSNCEHHMLPFFGTIHVAYIPDKKITGLSKIPRLVEVFSKRLQNQERLTVQIAKTLMEELSPKGVAIQVSGIHMCMCSRGIKNPDAETITTAFLGTFKTEPSLRSDFFDQIKTS